MQIESRDDGNYRKPKTFFRDINNKIVMNSNFTNIYIYIRIDAHRQLSHVQLLLKNG